MSQLFASGVQSIGASASTSVLPMKIQGWFLLGLTSLIFLLSKEQNYFTQNSEIPLGTSELSASASPYLLKQTPRFAKEFLSHFSYQKGQNQYS